MAFRRKHKAELDALLATGIQQEYAQSTLAEKYKEGEKIKYKIPRDCFLVSLAIQGKTFSSEAFARKLEDIKTYNNSHIVFIIGGSNGLSKDILQKFCSFSLTHPLRTLDFRAFRKKAFSCRHGS